MSQCLAGVNGNKSKVLFVDAKTETKADCCTQRLMGSTQILILGVQIALSDSDK